MHGAVLVCDCLPIVSPCVQTLHLVLDLTYHRLIILGFGLLDRLDWIGCKLLDLLLARLKLLQLCLTEPFLRLT